MSNEIPIAALALEYLKSKFEIGKALRVKDYYEKYLEIYEELYELERKRKSDISTEAARAWLSSD